MDASSKAWRYYKKGIIDADDDCGISMNHAVVIVGYTAKGATPPATEKPKEKEEPTPEPEKTVEKKEEPEKEEEP